MPRRSPPLIQTITERGLRGIAAYTDAAPDRVTHVSYPDLVRDAASVVADLVARTGAK